MKCFYGWVMAGALSVGACGPLQAGPTAYVATDGAHVYPYDTWEKAASNLQAAVDAVDAGGTVWVTNGVYAAGGAEVYGMSNRVALTRAVRLLSVNGPDVTFIQGQGPLGEGAVRCAYLTNGAALAGFTLTNGFTRQSGGMIRERSGGGAWLDRGGTVSSCTVCCNTAKDYGGGIFFLTGGTVRNCTIKGNTSSLDGGGVHCSEGAMVQNCSISANSAAEYGGGVYCAYGGALINCLVSSNSSFCSGGGAYCDYGGALTNCTVAGNFTEGSGGGIDCRSGGSFLNTIVFTNNVRFPNAVGSTPNVCGSSSRTNFLFCCTAPAMIGTGNFGADPLFIDAAAGNYRLQTNSPCINTGFQSLPNDFAMDLDLDGKKRVLLNRIDMGAYEAGFRIISYASGNGIILPFGVLDQLQGRSLTFTVIPNNDCYLSDLLVDGQSTGLFSVTNLRYTLENVTDNHTVSATFLAKPNVTYVSTNGASLRPYDTWEKATAVIQDAVDNLRSSGGTVWVSNGVYAAGGATVYGMSNRVALTRAVMLQSVNGPEVTSIEGQGPLGEGAVRCAYVTNGAALAGFTLANGYTRTSGDTYYERSGGGVWLDRGGMVSNCVVSGNRASYRGGGVCLYQEGTAHNCMISGNTAYSGGGVELYYGGTVRNCMFSKNTSSHSGGGIYCDYGGAVNNCTVTGNSASKNGGGIYCYYGGALTNTIVFANTCTYNDINIGSVDATMSVAYCCTTPAVSGSGNIAADPLFVNAVSGDFRLQPNSPCINAGLNQAWMAGATDLDGKPRVIHGTVDMGAYEAILPGWDEDADGLPDEWEWGKAQTLTGLAPDADADGDGADNLAEYGADTDPFSGSSLLELTSVASEAGGMRVAWRGGQNAWQFLERSTNLSDGAAGWTAVYTNAPPTALSAEALDATPAGGKAFYRVRAQR